MDSKCAFLLPLRLPSHLYPRPVGKHDAMWPNDAGTGEPRSSKQNPSPGATDETQRQVEHLCHVCRTFTSCLWPACRHSAGGPFPQQLEFWFADCWHHQRPERGNGDQSFDHALDYLQRYNQRGLRSDQQLRLHACARTHVHRESHIYSDGRWHQGRPTHPHGRRHYKSPGD